MREGYESLTARRRWVVVVFGAIVTACVVAVGFSFSELNMLDRIESGALVGDDELAANDNRIRAIGLIQTGITIVGAVVFIRWLRAAYRNADLLAPGVRRYGHGWAIGAWFVPILNLWRPKQIINDVWKAGALSGDDRRRPPVLLLTWWLSWIAGTLLGNLATRSTGDEQTLDDFRNTDFLWIVSDSWDAVNAVMAVAVVVHLTRRLDRKAAVAEPAPAEAPVAAAPATTWLAPERPESVG